MFKYTVKTIADQTGESTAAIEVLSLVRIIEDKITDAVGHKLNEIEIQLPMEFIELKYLTRSQAQTLVYGRLIEELDIAGYESVITLYNDITMIKIKWRSALDHNLEREMKSIIVSHLSTSNKKEK